MSLTTEGRGAHRLGSIVAGKARTRRFRRGVGALAGTLSLAGAALLAAAPASATAYPIGNQAPEIAFHGTNGDLWTACTEATGDCVQGQAQPGLDPVDTGLAMAAGTSPASAYSGDTGGRDEFAFQGANGDLWTAGVLGTKDTGLAMQPGTSPAITLSGTSGYAFDIAFQSSTGELETRVISSTAAAVTTNWDLPMDTHSSPSITAAGTGDGGEVAYQTNYGHLATLSSTGTAFDTYQIMRAGTTPSIAEFAAGYEVAYQGNNDELALYGALGNKSLGLPMDDASSPSIAAITGSTYEIAYQTNYGHLETVGNAGIPSGDTYQIMRAGSSPAITGNVLLDAATPADYIVAYQTNSDVLSVYSAYETSFSTGLSVSSTSSPASSSGFTS